MSRLSTPVKLALAALALGLLGWFAYISIEFYEETEEGSWSIAALRNPYLAAQEFMHRSGIDVTDVDSLARLDELSSIGTLFFSGPNQVQTPRQLEQVMDWLDVGGNVIYSASSVAHEDDLLLAEFEVEVQWRDYENEPDTEADEKSISETMRDYNRQIEEGKKREDIVKSFRQRNNTVTEISFGDDIGRIDADFDNSKVLAHPHIADADYSEGRHNPFSWSYSGAGVQMMQFEVGSGLLTIVSDPKIWTSYQIDQYDHAYLLWLLSSGDGSFAILRSVVRDSIWVLIMRNAAELLLAAGLLILLWIWRSGYRFGRLLPRDLTRRRALAEHFSSISHYLWHRRRGAYLVQPLRQRVLSRASLVLGEFSRAEPERQYRLLAERCDLNPGAIARAFTIDDFNETSFVQTARLLKRIEQSL